MHLRPFVMIACTLSIALTAPARVAASPPQESDANTPAEPQVKPAEPQVKPDEKPAAVAEETENAKPKGSSLSDRLEVRMDTVKKHMADGTSQLSAALNEPELNLFNLRIGRPQ